MGTSFPAEILRTLLALAVVALLAWACLALLRRLQQGRGMAGNARAGSELRFVRALPVGAKERVVVVQYRGDECLLGVTSGGISLLARTPIVTADPPPET